MSYASQTCSTRDGGTHAVDGRLYYFFHIPKTGGRTIERHITNRFGLASVAYPRKNKRFYTDLFARRKCLRSPSASQTHIIGHFASWTLLDGSEAKYYKACFWRHPADWWLSLYNYRHHRNAAKLKRGFSFFDFCRSQLRNPMTEHFLLYCGDVPGWKYFLMSDRQKFELACSLLLRFDRFSDIASVNNFIKVIGFSDGNRPADYNRIKPQDKVLPALDERTRIKIERANGVDYYLYKLAKCDDRERVLREGRQVLRSSFDPRDVRRLIAMPYYRFRTWVLPFLALPKLRQRTSGKRSAHDTAVRVSS